MKNEDIDRIFQLLRYVELRGQTVLDEAHFEESLGNLLHELAALRERGRCETAAVRDVTAERRRQTEVEGWTVEHDDEHGRNELADAAAAYALRTEDVWPWGDTPPKFGDRRRELVKAGALILAEIERLDRLPLPEAPR